MDNVVSRYIAKACATSSSHKSFYNCAILPVTTLQFYTICIGVRINGPSGKKGAMFNFLRYD